jgi:hypothetical protein
LKSRGRYLIQRQEEAFVMTSAAARRGTASCINELQTTLRQRTILMDETICARSLGLNLARDNPFSAL